MSGDAELDAGSLETKAPGVASRVPPGTVQAAMHAQTDEPE